MNNIKDHFLIGMFDQNLSKILVFFALTGIAMSIYPVYEGLYDDTSKKIALIKQWNDLGIEELPAEAIDAVREQLEGELKSNAGRVEATITLLSNKTSGYSVWKCVGKFFAGMSLLLITYGILFVFHYMETEKKYRKGVWRDNMYIIIIMLIMGILNMCIPFMSTVVNYIFIPSCLTLLVALIMLIRNYAKKQIEESIKLGLDI